MTFNRTSCRSTGSGASLESGLVSTPSKNSRSEYPRGNSFCDGSLVIEMLFLRLLSLWQLPLRISVAVYAAYATTEPQTTQLIGWQVRTLASKYRHEKPPLCGWSTKPSSARVIWDRAGQPRSAADLPREYL